MCEVRKDLRGRKLRNGESQRADGRYRYKYVDLFGNPHDVYSWTLNPSDRAPDGKKDGPSLREMEKKIKEGLVIGIVPDGGAMNVVQLCFRYINTRNDVRQTTRNGYTTVMNILKNHPFGKMQIDKVNTLIAKEFLIKLQQEDGRSYSSIHCIRGVLRPAFELAKECQYVRNNPFSFPLAKVLVNDAVMREAITRDQERKFLKFIAEDKHFSKYYDGIYILFNTGMRIAEFCGLTLTDIDLKNRTITINHQMQRNQDGSLYVVDKNTKRASTKTKAGERIIPMTDGVYQAVKNIIKNRPKLFVEPEVDGYTKFLNLTVYNGLIRPSVPMDWEHYFNHIVAKYNRIYKEELPNITPHVCRHTYCSKMANSGMNPKTLQYLMGHSDISVTLGIYAHTNAEDARREFDAMVYDGRMGDLG